MPRPWKSFQNLASERPQQVICRPSCNVHLSGEGHSLQIKQLLVSSLRELYRAKDATVEPSIVASGCTKSGLLHKSKALLCRMRLCYNFGLRKPDFTLVLHVERREALADASLMLAFQGLDEQPAHVLHRSKMLDDLPNELLPRHSSSELTAANPGPKQEDPVHPNSELRAFTIVQQLAATHDGVACCLRTLEIRKETVKPKPQTLNPCLRVRKHLLSCSNPSLSSFVSSTHDIANTKLS